MEFKDKVIVVTGAGSDPGEEVVGFGYQIAKDLYDRNAKVAIIGRRKERLYDAMQRIAGDTDFNERFSAHECDIANGTQVKQIFWNIKEIHGAVFGLVNNAAINTSRSPTLDTEEEALRRMFEVNVIGTFNCTKEALAQMLSVREKVQSCCGSIVNISSVGANKPFKNMAGYPATKRAIESFAASDADTYGPLGVRVNVVRPGYAETPLTTRFFESLRKNDPDRMQTIVRRQPYGGLVRPEQISEAVLTLLDPTSTLNGKVIEVSNGYDARF